ncbi:RNA polymerase sigma factor [Mariniphaga sediminis]|nr:sigma-70 family RNA polymerase sigma factor [Mariniphaga sediminis]
MMQDSEGNTDYLWKEFKRGNQLAFASIYNLYVDRLFIYGSKLTPDRELVKDCIQEVFFDLYNKRHSLSDTDNIRYYLLKSLKNTLLRKIQRERRIIELNKKTTSDFNIEYSFEKKIIENEIEEEKKLLVKTILADLNDKQKEILFLRFMQGLSYSEISEIVDIASDSVKKQVYRTVKKIRKSLGAKTNMIFYLFFNLQKVSTF